MRVIVTAVISILPFIYCVFRQVNAQSNGGIFARTSGPCSTKPCGKRATCIAKSDGSFVCRCKTGFQGKHPECVDKNECLHKPPKCGVNKRCKNTLGSYECQCLAGYTMNSTGGCTDVDECASFPCGTGALCTNLPGTYNCTCLEGYYGNPEEACIDVNECEQSPCAVNTFCKNLEGSYECQCSPVNGGNLYEVCYPPTKPYCYEDGVLCQYGVFSSYSNCRSCCNPGTFWTSMNSVACGQCWEDFRECDPETTCLTLCCSGGHSFDGSTSVCGNPPC